MARRVVPLPGWSALVAGVLVLGFGVGAAGAGTAGSTHATSANPPRIAGGLYDSLALTSAGAAYGWGWNVVGQIGDGSTTGSAVPVPMKLPGGARAIAVATGFAHSAVATSTGAVYSWGKNDDGDLGNGSTADSAQAVKANLPAGAKVTDVAVSEHDLAVTSAGALFAWGFGQYGQLGNGGTGSSSNPVSVTLPAGVKVTAVAVGSLHSVALTSTGSVLAWGYNADGELGDGNRKNSALPVRVKLPAHTKVVAIAAGGYYSLALTSSGSVLAWGYNADGELGNGVSRSSVVPVRVKLAQKAVAIAAGGPLMEVGDYVAGPGHSLAVTSSGAVYAWGYNAEGQLGNGSTSNSHVPVKVKLAERATAVAAGQLQSLAMTSGGLFAWGGNNFGQLGDGSYEGSDVPVKVNLP
jgi:alpha-tubulin suppressor-like RCC1 family protein